MAHRTTIRLPKELKSEARQIASEEGRSLNALIEEALLSLIDQRGVAPREGKRETDLPPASWT